MIKYIHSAYKVENSFKEIHDVGEREKLSTLKHQLEEKRRKGVKYVLWCLNEYQKHYLENFKYQPVPWLYWIKTKEIANVSIFQSKLIKEVHAAKKRGNKDLYKTLTPKDLETLTEYGVEYYVCKYKINTTPVSK